MQNLLPCHFSRPARSDFTAAALEKQRVWILRDSDVASQDSDLVQGVVVLSLSPECRRYVAGKSADKATCSAWLV